MATPDSNRHVSILPEKSFRRLLSLAFILPILFIAAWGSVMGTMSTNANNARQIWIDRQKLVSDARTAQARLLDMETSEKAFLLTGDKSYLRPYEEGIPIVAPLLDNLVRESHRPEQQSRASLVRSYSEQWLKVSRQIVGEKSRGRSPPSASLMVGERLIDSVGKSFDDYLSSEAKLVESANRSLDDWRVRATGTLFGGAAFLAIVLAFTSSTLLRKLSQVYRSALVAFEQESAIARETGDLYRLVTEKAGDLICRLDLERRFTYVSPSFEKVLGYPPADLLGKGMIEFLHPEDAARAPEIRKRLQDAGFVNVLIRLRTSAGEWKWVEAASTSTPTGQVFVGRDVTGRIAVEQEIRALNTQLEERVSERTADLANANKELEAFSYSVSHDLRAPVRSISSFSSILQQDLAGKLDEESADNLNRIRLAASRMTALIDALLRFGRIARAEVNRSEVDVSEMADSIANELLADKRERHVQVRIQSGMVDQADPNLLKVVLENLFENAFKFTSHKDDACVELLRQADGTYLMRDNGAGFEEQFVSKIFLPFERLHKESEFPGTGIGLATTKRIIDRHGGRIWAKGKVGQGAEFFFTLHG